MSHFSYSFIYIEKYHILIRVPNFLFLFPKSTMGQIHRLVKLLQDPVIRSQGPEFAEALFQALVNYSESFSMRIGVHRALFRNVLLMLGSDEQRDEWLDAVDNYRIFGCFAMVAILLFFMVFLTPFF